MIQSIINNKVHSADIQFVIIFNMRLVLIFALVASVLAEPVAIVRRYHEEQGIPRAEQIRVAEELVVKNLPQERIVGGSLAPVNEHPYLAGLLIDLVDTNNVSVCGASLLSANRLVTAAHCWYDGSKQARQFTVVLGTLLFNSGTRIVTQEVIMHDSWNTENFQNDIAMIYLPSNVTFSESIAAIAFPEGSELSMTFEGQTAVAAGYGRTSDQQAAVALDAAVRQVSVKVISTRDCQAQYRFVTEQNICTAGTDGVGTCSGDSGGPLVITSNGRPVLVGIASFVSAEGCQISFPSGFTRTTKYNTFIRQNL